MAAVNITIRLEQDVVDRLEAFCAKTHRSRADVIRAAIDLFLADGDQAAELRLTQQLWTPAGGQSGDTVIAMKEQFPAKSGRQLIVFTPAGYTGSAEQLKHDVRQALDNDALEVHPPAGGRTGTQGD